jgi:hypothetical protein
MYFTHQAQWDSLMQEAVKKALTEITEDLNAAYKLLKEDDGS